MVTIINYKVERSKSGEEYIRLQIQSDDLNVVTTESGSQYVNAPQATIISTISEEVAKTQLGRKLPGTIERIRTDPWTFTDRQTGEQKTLHHRYIYDPEGKPKVADEVAV